MDLEFPSLTRDDFPRVARWLHEPNVDAWWRQPLDLEGVGRSSGRAWTVGSRPGCT